MKIIFEGIHLSIKEIIKTAGKLVGLDDNAIKEQLKKYKNPESNYVCLHSIYVNDKGNLIISKNDVRTWLTEECFKNAVSSVKERLSIPRVESNFPYSALKRDVNNYKYYHKGLNKDVEGFYIKRQKIIISPKGAVYFANGNKIRRVGKDELYSSNYSSAFIARTICDPLVGFLNPNFFTQDICKTIDKTYVNYTALKLEIGNAYRNEIGKIFPLVKYTSTWCTGTLHPLKTVDWIPNNVRKLMIDPTLYNDASINSRVKYMNYGIVRAYYLCKYLKLKDPNVIQRFLEFYVPALKAERKYIIQKSIQKDSNTILIPPIQYAFNRTIHPLLTRTYFKYLKDYYQDKIKNVEVLLADRVLKDDWKTNDSFQMFGTALKTRKKYKDLEFKPLDMTYLITHSLKDIHDSLSIIVRDDTLILNYKKFEVKDKEKFEQCVKGPSDKSYYFFTPHDSNELVRLADVMKNCVAGFQRNIESGESIIVYATSSNEVLDYIQNNVGDIRELTRKMENSDILSPACIELTKFDPKSFSRLATRSVSEDILNLSQCYGRHNKHLDDINPELNEVCNKYFDSLGITSRCSRYSF